MNDKLLNSLIDDALKAKGFDDQTITHLRTICGATGNPMNAIAMILGRFERPGISTVSDIKEDAELISYNPLKNDDEAVEFSYQTKKTKTLYWQPKDYASEELALDAYNKNPDAWINNAEPGYKYSYVPTGELLSNFSTCSVEDWNAGKRGTRSKR